MHLSLVLFAFDLNSLCVCVCVCVCVCEEVVWGRLNQCLEFLDVFVEWCSNNKDCTYVEFMICGPLDSVSSILWDLCVF